VNDLKAEIADLEDHLKFTKEKLRETEIEMTELKRSNHQQSMIINRYKKMVAEMNSSNSSHAFLQKGEGNNASMSDVNATMSYRK
jgi:predicted RNase H-like nuclease (RuvC/YqgF family)